MRRVESHDTAEACGIAKHMATQAHPIFHGARGASSTERSEERMTQLIQKQFEGNTINTILYEGQPCWVAKEVGRVLGYAQDGSRLVKNIRDDWASDFIEGTDYAVLGSRELNQLRELTALGTESVPSRAGSLVVLFETGIHMALIKTNKEVGRRLRRFLVKEVMPQLARDGRYDPDCDLTSEHLQQRDAKLRELHLRERELDQRVAEYKRECLLYLVSSLKQRDAIAPDVADSYLVVATEVGTGMALSQLKPQVEETWRSPTEIASQLGTTVHKVGRAISQLGIRGNVEGVSRAIVNKAKGHERTVTSYIYAPSAIERIADVLDRDQPPRLASGT
jgi:prophage antirepressor-like protein